LEYGRPDAAIFPSLTQEKKVGWSVNRALTRRYALPTRPMTSLGNQVFEKAA
jgi:hypothetical protein